MITNETVKIKHIFQGIELKTVLRVEYVVQVTDVADSQSQDFDFRQFLIGRQSGQQLA